MTRSVFREKEYFDEIISSKLKSFEGQETKINSGELSVNKLAFAKRGQLFKLYGTILAKYSRGDKIHEIAPIFSKLVEKLTKEKWEETFVKFTYSNRKKRITENQPTLEFHNLLLNVLSIGVLIDCKKEYFESLRQFILNYGIEYKLFDIFINYKIKEHPIRESKYKLTQYKKLNELIESEITDKRIISYQQKWFQSLSPTYFYIYSTTNGSMFHGYWCFESAALAKINSLEIDELYDNVYFPTDLYKNDGSFFEYKVSLEYKLLNSIDLTMRDVGKYWGIRNPSNEIYIARRILQRYNKRRYKELGNLINRYYETLNKSNFPNKEKVFYNFPQLINNLGILLENYNIEYKKISIEEIKEESNPKASFWNRLKRKM